MDERGSSVNQVNEGGGLLDPLNADEINRSIKRLHQAYNPILLQLLRLHDCRVTTYKNLKV